LSLTVVQTFAFPICVFFFFFFLIKIKPVVRLSEYSTTKPPEKSNFQPIATRLLSIPRAAKLSSNNRHVSSYKNR